MNSLELQEIINTLPDPIYKIEQDLGMPVTTLNKALKNGRGLPRKWAIKFREKYQLPHPQTVTPIVGEVPGEIKPDNIEKKVEVLNVHSKIPPRPTNDDFKGLELKLKQSEWDEQYGNKK